MHKDLKKYTKGYETAEDAALGLIAEGVRELETVLFGRGELLALLSVLPDGDDGYHVEVVNSEDLMEEADDADEAL